jgi:hypothetical protein
MKFIRSAIKILRLIKNYSRGRQQVHYVIIICMCVCARSLVNLEDEVLKMETALSTCTTTECYNPHLTLKVEVVCSSKTLVSTYKTIRCLNSKDHNLYIRKYVYYINTGSPCLCGNFFGITVKQESLDVNDKALSILIRRLLSLELFESS